ncbi:hypothetical protein [uncultured Duncaniella sp.]|uniref:hypothetical protein n=1 Tax=uncultured Duncaniella sp. TaxID=2768039 RepID=UPI0025AA1142|nr:hypothetical protein [uncultured Duncaniella sp.]
MSANIILKIEWTKPRQRIEIDRSPVRPVVVLEADGSRRACYRVKDENILAPELMVRAWVASANSEGCVISFSTAEKSLVDMLDDGPVAVEDFMLSAHVSRALAEDIVILLHSMGLLDFRYDGKIFRLTRRPEAE